MAYILNIHTSTETAIINLSHDSQVLGTLINADTKQHASFLHAAISSLLKQESVSINLLNAIAVTIGPGSYTGIRVGLAAAKGLCYALNIPLITMNTLEVMALTMIDNIQEPAALYCPMIDARRMEVYTAIYNYDLNEVEPPSAKVLNENSFEIYQGLHKIIFAGSGSKKFRDLTKIINASFIETEISPESLTKFSWKNFQNSKLTDVAFAEPLYIKEFYTIGKK